MSRAKPYAGPRQTNLEPDADIANRFLHWWFESCEQGVIEIGVMDPAGRGLSRFRQFDLGDPEAGRFAAGVNRTPGCSVYFRASTVRKRAANEGGFTEDADVIQTPGVWRDFDTAEQMAHAEGVVSPIKPAVIITTGLVPHRREQHFFRLTEPLADGAQVRLYNERLLALYGGDQSVVNPSRLMRLPGMIAWPWKAGRVPELTAWAFASAEDHTAADLDHHLPPAGKPAAALDVERAPAGPAKSDELVGRIMSGDQWHNNALALVAQRVRRGWTDEEILIAADSWTQPGYGVDDTRAEIAVMIEGARKKGWGPAPDAGDEFGVVPGAAAPARRGLLIESRAEWMNAPPRPQRIKGLFGVGDLVLVCGEPASGKSAVTPKFASAIAREVPVFGCKVAAPGPVIYCAGEDAHGLKNRLRALDEVEGVADNLLVASDFGDLLTPGSADAEALLAEIRERKPAAVVIDTLAACFGAIDENSSVDMGRVIAFCRQITATGATCIMTHHPAKGGSSPRGHGSLAADADVILHLHERDEQGVTRISFSKNRNGSTDRVLNFRLGVHTLGHDEDGDPLTAVYAIEADAGRAAPKVTGQAREALDVLSDMGGRAHKDDWRRQFIGPRESPEYEAKRKAFSRAVDKLRDLKLVDVSGLSCAVANYKVPAAAEFDVYEPEPAGTSGTFRDMSRNVPARVAEDSVGHLGHLPLGMSRMSHARPGYLAADKNKSAPSPELKNNGGNDGPDPLEGNEFAQDKINSHPEIDIWAGEP